MNESQYVNDEKEYLRNKYIAFLKFMKKLKLKNYKIINVRDVNKDRHRIVFTDRGNFYLLYKKDYYNSFSTKYADFIYKVPAMRGVGDSINVDFLNLAIQKKVNFLVFIHETETFIVDPQDMKEYCEKNHLKDLQDKNNKYRGNEGRGYNIHELTYRIPKSWLDLYNLEGEI